MIDVLTSRTDAPLNLRNFEGQTPLLLACVNRSDARVVRALLSAGADPNIVSNVDRSPLHEVTNRQAAQALISHGGNVNAQDFNGYTPLHCAVERDDPEVLETLLDAEADTSLTECNGLTPLMLALQCEVENSCANRLVSVTRNLDAAAFDGWTALMLAANCGRTDVVRSLVERGAGVDALAEGVTALHLAVMRRDVEMFTSMWQAAPPRPNPAPRSPASVAAHSLPHLMIIHRWYVGERLNCLLQVLSRGDFGPSAPVESHHHNFLDFLFRTELDSKLELVACDVLEAALRSGIHRVTLPVLTAFIENWSRCGDARKLLDVLISSAAADGHRLTSGLLLMAIQFAPELVARLLESIGPACVDLRVLLHQACSARARDDVHAVRLSVRLLGLCTPSPVKRQKYAQLVANGWGEPMRPVVRYTIRDVWLPDRRPIRRHRAVEYVPSEDERHAMMEAYEALCCRIRAVDVPSLCELSRDAVRSRLTSVEAMAHLPLLPQHIVDILTLRSPVNHLPPGT